MIRTVLLLTLAACVVELPTENHTALRVDPSAARLHAATGSCAATTLTVDSSGPVALVFGAPTTPCAGLELPVGGLDLPDGGVVTVPVSFCPPIDATPGGSCGTTLPIAWNGPEGSGTLTVSLSVEALPYDADEDGFFADDCDPAAPTVHPDAVEVPDGRDNDCDGAVDEGTAWSDDDGDGWTEWNGDCDGADPRVGPAALEAPNGLDDDCDGLVDEDTHLGDDDHDGYSEGDGDCNDANPLVYPLAGEVRGPSFLPDGVDNDCDGSIDEVTP
jgi:hypothetical protein